MAYTGMRAALAGIIGLATTLAPAAAERPSFDCGKASTATEQAICSNDRLARLDRAIAAAFRALRAKVDLTEEQTAFLAKRDACGAAVGCLAQEMESRRAALALEPRRGSKDPRERFVGWYADEHGEMIVRRTLAGEIWLSGSVADPGARWVCDVAGPVESVKNGVATVEVGDEKDRYVIFMKLQGNVLVVTEDLQKPLMGYACGHNGTVEGRYKRTRRRP
jgi:uncharacterized protein YecT (DUF1311 family)